MLLECVNINRTGNCLKVHRRESQLIIQPRYRHHAIGVRIRQPATASIFAITN
jgi:hypothetical protein